MSNTKEISFVDVKELYDAAYAEQAELTINLERYTSLMTRAIELDEAYRAQLATSPAFSYGRAAA